MFRFPFLLPSAGDRLLRRATRCTLELQRWPVTEEDADCHSSVTFEVHGELPLRGSEACELLASLIHEFRTPLQGHQEGGVQ